MRLTVFTPTFNRKATLGRVYDSLCRQTFDFGQFEWLVVDDGSTDGSRDLVTEWQTKAPFAIRYIWQENVGKHRAWNRAMPEAHADLVLPLDSDDACVPHALGRLVEIWDAVPADERRNLAGIIARCQDAEGRPYGEPMPPVSRSDYAELAFVYDWRWEAWTLARRDILCRYPFAPGPERLYVPEGHIWHRISRDYRWILANECLRIYFTGQGHGRADQISQPKPLKQQAPGMVLALESMLGSSFRYFRTRPGEFTRSAVHYGRFSLHAKMSVPRQISRLEPLGAKLLCIAGLPLACTMYALDVARERPSAPQA